MNENKALVKQLDLNSLGLLFLRVSMGLTMALAHGLPKAMTLSHGAVEFPDPLGVGPTMSLAMATFGELIGSLAVVVGFRTRIAAVLPLFTMLVAIIFIHPNDPWAATEFCLLYVFAFFTLILTGGGAYTLDSLIGCRQSCKLELRKA